MYMYAIAKATCMKTVCNVNQRELLQISMRKLLGQHFKKFKTTSFTPQNFGGMAVSNTSTCFADPFWLKQTHTTRNINFACKSIF